MIYFSVLLLISSVYAQTNNCTFSKSNLAANWTLTSQGLDIHFTNTDVNNDQGTIIYFGDIASNSSLVVFVNDENQADVITGFQDLDGNTSIDLTNQATVHYAKITGNVLNALVTLPLTFHDLDMTACHDWIFDQIDGIEFQQQVGPATNNVNLIGNVCPSKCT